MVRGKILLRRQAVPKKVTLPNRRTFYAKYERVCRKNLLGNITIKRNRAIVPQRQRKQRDEAGIDSILKTRMKFGSKFFNSANKKLKKKE